jgi:hypothetical protein
LNDARTQRDRAAALDAVVDRMQSPPGDCNAAALFTTTTQVTYPTTATAFFAVLLTDVGSPEVEGGSATYTTGTAIFQALNIGTAVPPSGTLVIAHATGGRWCFRFDG